MIKKAILIALLAPNINNASWTIDWPDPDKVKRVMTNRIEEAFGKNEEDLITKLLKCKLTETTNKAYHAGDDVCTECGDDPATANAFCVALESTLQICTMTTGTCT